MPADTHDAAGLGCWFGSRENVQPGPADAHDALGGLGSCQTLVAEVLMLLRVVMPARPANAVLAPVSSFSLLLHVDFQGSVSGYQFFLVLDVVGPQSHLIRDRGSLLLARGERLASNTRTHPIQPVAKPQAET